MKPKLLVPLVAGICAWASAASGQAPSLSGTVKSLEARGYQVLDAEAEGRVVDVDALTVDRRKVDLLVDAASGAILNEKADD